MRRLIRLAHRIRPLVRALEERIAPAVYPVTNLANSGVGSLRDAVLSANGSPGGDDTVSFQAGLTGTIVLTGGDIGITDEVVIQGPGAKSITINGNGVGRIFTTKNAPAGAYISIRGLTLTGGNAVGGGAIFSDDETLFIGECAISANTSTAAGGGVYMSGNGTLTMSSCTISGNSAAGDGGGIDINGTTAELHVNNCTLSGNTAFNDGGAIHSRFELLFGAAFTISNCTITGNMANVGRGGGLAVPLAISQVTGFSIVSCIVSGNIAPTGADLFSYCVVHAKHSAIGSKAGVATFNGDAKTNALLGQDFKLGALTDNGGDVFTHKPAIDSPVRDQGDTNFFANDGRGSPFPREVNGLADCGAVECDPLFIVRNDYDSGPDSLRQQVLDANVIPGPDVITFDPIAFASTDGTITLGSEISITASVTIQGLGARQVAISGDNLRRAFGIAGAPASSVVAVSFLRVSGGAAINGGGAFFVGDETLVLTGCTISNNSAFGNSNGGGILVNQAGTLNINDCTFTGNSAVLGGAIFMANAGGSLSITNSTFAGNSAIDGGAIYSLGGGGPGIAIRNSTIADNSAASFAGGIFHNGANITLLALENTVIAGNSALFGTDIYAFGVVIAKHCGLSFNNIIDTFIPNAQTTALQGKDFKLGKLANNGGPNNTILPTIVTSPLVDAGLNVINPVNDQRGVGYPRIRGGAIDIGAVDFPSPLIVTNTLSTGAGSLRQAVTDANAFIGEDTITFDPAVFASPTTITLGSAIAVSDAVEIQGRGANLTTINAANNGRIFNTTAIPTGGKFALSGLKLMNGDVAGDGGAITMGDETAFIVSCYLTGNSAANSGGGIFMNGGSLIMQDCTLASNVASGGKGGGLNFMGAGNLTIRNCTFSSNTNAGGSGGGLVLENHTGTATILNSTFTLNSSFSGGGISRFGGTSTINLESCIVSNNAATSAPDVATSGTLDAKTSLLGTVSAATFTKDATTNSLLGQAAKIDALADNGGPTPTHALQATSPAISKGSNPYGLLYDQRGIGFPRIAGAAVDIGAVERTVPAHVASVIVGDGTAQRSTVTQLKVSFDTIVTFVGTPQDAINLLRVSPAPITAVTLTANVDNSSGVTVVTLTFTGGSVDGKSLADGRYNLNVLAAQFTGAGFDGNGDGVAGDDYTLSGDPAVAPKLFRFFGDVDGDGAVAANDFIQFRLSLGGNNPIFDIDGDGAVAASDFIQFRLRFGGGI